MARLPSPLSQADKDKWGTLLNEFNLVEHNPDGTHKDAVTTSQLATKADAADLAAKADIAAVEAVETSVTALTPGPGEVIVGGATGPMAVRTGQRGNRTIALGDSVTAANLGVGGPVNAQTHGGRSYATLLGLLTNGRVDLIRNAGVPGNTTAQMLARLQSDVVAYAPDRCIVIGGTNDAPTVPVATTIANLTAIWETLRANTIEPIACTIPPRADAKTEVARINAAILHAAARRGVDVVDVHAALVDPATGGYQSAYDNGDGIHPSNAGALVIAQTLQAKTESRYPIGGPFLTSATGSTLNLAVNGLFEGDTNADGVANSWVLGGSGGTVTPSIETDTAIPGNWQVLTTTAAGQRTLQQNITTGWSVGDTVELSGRIRTQGIAAGNMKVYVRLEHNATGQYIAYAVYELLLDMEAVFRCRAVIPAGTTQIRPMIATGTTGTGTVKVAQVTITNLTALGVA